MQRVSKLQKDLTDIRFHWILGTYKIGCNSGKWRFWSIEVQPNRTTRCCKWADGPVESLFKILVFVFLNLHLLDIFRLTYLSHILFMVWQVVTWILLIQVSNIQVDIQQWVWTQLSSKHPLLLHNVLLGIFSIQDLPLVTTTISR